jgi:hypothetical protein
VTPPEAVKKKPLSPAGEAADGTAPAHGTVAELTPDSLGAVWPQVLSQIGVLLANDLAKAGLPAIFAPNALAIRFPVAYTKERDFCQEPSRLAKIEAALARVTGQTWTLRVESTAGPAPVAAPPAPDVPKPTPSRPRRNDRDEAEKEPLIKRALDVLGAQILRVPEGFGTALTVRTEGPDAAPEQEN